MKSSALIVFVGLTAAALAVGRPAYPEGEEPASPGETAAAPQPAEDSMVEVAESTASAMLEPAVAAKKISERKVSLTLQGTPLTQILKAISRQTGASFIIAKELEDRRFSAFINKVTVREALRALLEAHGMGYEQVGTSNTFVVKELSRTRGRTATRIFRLKYTQLAEPSGAEAPSQSAFTIVTSGGGGKEAAAPAGKGGGQPGGGLVNAVASMLSDRGRLQVDPQTNSLIVTDVPENFPAVEDLIENLDTLVPQILIEVDVVETSADTGRKLGLEYGGAGGALASLTGPSRLLNFPRKDSKGVFAGPVDLAGATIKDTSLFGGSKAEGISFGMLSFQEFTVILRALETSGEGQFLAKPKILTLNNKPAEISITADTAVGLQSSSLIAQNGLLSTTAERRKTGIFLRVTPQVNDGNLVTLLIEPTISRPQPSEFFPTQFVDSQSRSIRTSVRVKDGNTLLIGGLLSNDLIKTVRRVPILGSIPVIGWLFSSVDKTTSKRELMIFITPRVARGL